MGIRGFVSFSAALLVAWALASPALHADWRDSLTPDVPGKLPPVRPFEAEYRLGWTDIEAGRAQVKITDSGKETIRLEASGATAGLARVLWQIDASLTSSAARKGLRPIYSVQKETYSARTILTQIVARPDGIWRLRENTPQGENPARWKRIKISPIRDIFSGALFLRSQSLAPGESFSAIIFPGDAPFFVELKALGTGPLTIGGSARDTLRLEIRLQRINLKKGATLEPQKKFQSGTVWLSNDADRIPLRVELNLFIGYVFAELETIRFPSR
ncbi:MAG: DUF3108 domain-containing protein [Verrucomicrobiae bacterium]